MPVSEVYARLGSSQSVHTRLAASSAAILNVILNPELPAAMTSQNKCHLNLSLTEKRQRALQTNDSGTLPPFKTHAALIWR